MEANSPSKANVRWLGCRIHRRQIRPPFARFATPENRCPWQPAIVRRVVYPPLRTVQPDSLSVVGAEARSRLRLPNR
eukprot:2692712-Pyramimonas_sp.AAC.1